VVVNRDIMACTAVITVEFQMIQCCMVCLSVTTELVIISESWLQITSESKLIVPCAEIYHFQNFFKKSC